MKIRHNGIPSREQSDSGSGSTATGRAIRGSAILALTILLIAAIGCGTRKEQSSPDYCARLKQCFEECNRRYPPQHGSNEIEVCLNSCIQDHGNPENCSDLNETP
ncbi:MAG TPA: hypothetical protein DEA96_05745 [Leptospiraceae bacterium]|nr:hypothetical protein [Spirochaetaceae bacterium]HBS04446.1 hypothetical protein [Leptospiraceae bacterium]